VKDPNSQANPQLRDILATALKDTTQEPNPPPEPPHIVVHGSGNVFSWGGSVYVQESHHGHH
jgi:hypothetical protein